MINLFYGENKQVWNALFHTCLCTFCLSALMISYCKYFLITVNPNLSVISAGVLPRTLDTPVRGRPIRGGFCLVDEGWPVPHVPQMSRKLPKNRIFRSCLEILAMPGFWALKPPKPLCRNGFKSFWRWTPQHRPIYFETLYHAKNTFEFCSLHQPNPLEP